MEIHTSPDNKEIGKFQLLNNLLSAFKCSPGKRVNHIPQVVDPGALDVGVRGGEEYSEI